MTKEKTPVPDAAKPTIVPDPEVDAKPQRRRFTAKYKLRILKEVDACHEPGQIGALLRREGLYSSNLSKWRQQQEAGALRELGKKRGRKAKPQNTELARLRRENARLLRENQQLLAINEIQKKVSNLLGIPLNSPDDDENA